MYYCSSRFKKVVYFAFKICTGGCNLGLWNHVTFKGNHHMNYTIIIGRTFTFCGKIPILIFWLVLSKLSAFTSKFVEFSNSQNKCTINFCYCYKIVLFIFIMWPVSYQHSKGNLCLSHMMEYISFSRYFFSIM